MTEMFHKLLLSELHMVTYQQGNPADITDDLICECTALQSSELFLHTHNDAESQDLVLWIH